MKTPTIIVLPKNYLFSKGLKMMMIYKTCWGEHLSYFYNYIMCDIYECEFKLVGRKMANLNERGRGISPLEAHSSWVSDPSCLQQKLWTLIWSFLISQDKIKRGEKNIFEYKITQWTELSHTTFVDDNHNHWNYTSGLYFQITLLMNTHFVLMMM